MRSCKELDIKTVAVFTEADRTSQHVFYANEAKCISEALSNASYLNIDNIDIGNITAMLSKIKSAVHQTSKVFQGERTSSNPKYVKTVCLQNINNEINEIQANSPILKGMENKGGIKVVGAVYHMETGKVNFLNY